MPSGETAPRGGEKYRPIATLGEGGMARVLLTLSSGPAGVQKLLVVKQIRPELARDAEFVTMFMDEARLAARLSHPNVIQTYEVGIEDSGPFIVMEYLDGQSLQALIGQVKRANMPLAVHLRILTKVLAGLHYAHELKDYNGEELEVVHRDVSPQNVFICYDGHVKVVDFGVAKVAGSAERTAAGTFKGKIGYIAPEQLSGEDVDRRADVFSVGVMLWEALAQRRLTANETAASAVHKRLHGMHPSIRDLHVDVDDELADICDRATAFSPVERYATAAEMHHALEAYLDVSGLRADERDIAALVCQAFADDRLRIRATIEEQIGRASEGRVRIGLPNLQSQAAISNAPPGMRSGSSPPTFSVTPSRYGASPQSRRIAVITSAVAAVLVVAALIKWATRPNVPIIATGAPAPSSLTKPMATPEPSDRAKVTLLIGVTPSKATVSLDGVPLATNPFRAVVIRDAKAHVLVATAPGYTPEERTLSFDQDAAIDLVLKRATGHATALPVAPPNPTAPAPGSDLKKAPRAKTSIDEEDPYQ